MSIDSLHVTISDVLYCISSRSFVCQSCVMRIIELRLHEER